jgi:pentatricopeptide repeat protein
MWNVGKGRMHRKVWPNSVTFVQLLNACAGLGALEDGMRVHGQIIQRGCELEVFVANS